MQIAFLTINQPPVVTQKPYLELEYDNTFKPEGGISVQFASKLATAPSNYSYAYSLTGEKTPFSLTAGIKAFPTPTPTGKFFIFFEDEAYPSDLQGNFYSVADGNINDNIIGVNKWDDIPFTRMVLQSKNLQFVPNQLWTACTSLQGMFRSAQYFNQDISAWDISRVKSLSNCFYGCTSFNQPLNSWNTSNVVDIGGMFIGASSFNQPINNWDTSNVTNMAATFQDAVSFNQDISMWNTGKVTTFLNTFLGASSFNQPLNSWNVGQVTNMQSMFNGAIAFNQPLNTWNTSKVTDMSFMFGEATSFNQNLFGWNVSNVTTYGDYDTGAVNWEEEYKPWYVEPTDPCSFTISYKYSYNNFTLVDENNVGVAGVQVEVLDVQSGSTSIVSSDSYGSFFLPDGEGNAQKTVRITFPDKRKTSKKFIKWQDTGIIAVNDWAELNLKGMQFIYCERLVSVPNSLWAGCETLEEMFRSCGVFNSPSVSSWDTSQITSMKSMFKGTRAFNQDISSWNVSKVVDVSQMFYDASAFNQDLSSMVFKATTTRNNFDTYATAWTEPRPQFTGV